MEEEKAEEEKNTVQKNTKTQKNTKKGNTKKCNVENTVPEKRKTKKNHKRKKKKKYRGGGGRKKRKDEFSVFLVNLRGFRSKKESLVEIIKKEKPNVIVMNETQLVGNMKVELQP